METIKPELGHWVSKLHQVSADSIPGHVTGRRQRWMVPCWHCKGLWGRVGHNLSLKMQNMTWTDYPLLSSHCTFPSSPKAKFFLLEEISFTLIALGN